MVGDIRRRRRKKEVERESGREIARVYRYITLAKVFGVCLRSFAPSSSPFFPRRSTILRMNEFHLRLRISNGRARAHTLITYLCVCECVVDEQGINRNRLLGRKWSNKLLGRTERSDITQRGTAQLDSVNPPRTLSPTSDRSLRSTCCTCSPSSHCVRHRRVCHIAETCAHTQMRIQESLVREEHWSSLLSMNERTNESVAQRFIQEHCIAWTETRESLNLLEWMQMKVSLFRRSLSLN